MLVFHSRVSLNRAGGHFLHHLPFLKFVLRNEGCHRSLLPAHSPGKEKSSHGMHVVLMALGFSLAGPVNWMDLRHFPQRKTMPSFSPVLALPFNLQMRRALAGKFQKKRDLWISGLTNSQRVGVDGKCFRPCEWCSQQDLTQWKAVSGKLSPNPPLTPRKN